MMAFERKIFIDKDGLIDSFGWSLDENMQKHFFDLEKLTYDLLLL